MQTNNIASSLTTLFSELVDGAKAPVGANFVLNSGDPGLLATRARLARARLHLPEPRSTAKAEGGQLGDQAA